MPGVRFIIIICTLNNRLKIVSDDGIQIALVHQLPSSEQVQRCNSRKQAIGSIHT